MSTSLRLLAVLNVLSSAPPRAKLLASRIHGLLPPLASMPCEKSRLEARDQAKFPMPVLEWTIVGTDVAELADRESQDIEPQ